MYEPDEYTPSDEEEMTMVFLQNYYKRTKKFRLMKKRAMIDFRLKWFQAKMKFCLMKNRAIIGFRLE